MFRKFSHSSIFHWLYTFDQWLNNNQCVLCLQHCIGISWCDRCLSDLPRWRAVDSIQIPFVSSTVVSFRYEYPINKLIQSAKYKSNYGLITSLAKLLPDVPYSATDAMIYPVPVSPWKLLRRGFNQTSVLAREKFKGKTIAIDEVSIHKRCFLPDQSSLDAIHRKTNARELFYAPSFLSTGHAIIIDDVITTGATVSAVAKILRDNGAKRVDVYALAAVP